MFLIVTKLMCYSLLFCLIILAQDLSVSFSVESSDKFSKRPSTLISDKSLFFNSLSMIVH